MDRTTKVELITSMIVLSLAPRFVFAQSLGESVRDARDVVEQFCMMDWEGRLLTPEGEGETARVLISPHKWYPGQEIVVTNSYVVSGPGKHGRTAHFDVDYQAWGTIDSSLSFARNEGRIPDKPIKERESYELVFTNKYNEFEQNRLKEVVKGPLSWRIETTPSRRHVSFETAIRYVTDIRDSSNDAVIKKNGDQTLILLKQLMVDADEQRPPNLRQTPVEVVKQLVKMDLDGKQLTPDGWTEMATFFVQPGSFHLKVIDIMKEIGVGNASIHDEKRAEVVTGSFRWGKLDSSTALFKLDPVQGIKLLGSYDLVLTDKHGKPGLDGDTAQEVNRSLEWRISGPPGHPQISVDTAIRYITEMRDKTTDPVIKKNAAKTLAELKHLH